VWDLFHVGHINAIKQAKSYGDHLTVCVCTADRISRTKRRPLISDENRLTMVRECRYVDHAILVNYRFACGAFYREYPFDILATNVTEWANDPEWQQSMKELQDSGVLIRATDYTNSISTSKIIAQIKAYDEIAI
jgi:cytidyltransferase-like protein